MSATAKIKSANVIQVDIDDSEKKSRAVAFMKKDAIKHIDTRTLNQKQYKTGTSNLMTILDNYLDRKE